MTLSSLPRPVRRFLDDRIDSVEQLEILLLLPRYADRSWNAAAVAAALGLTPRTAERHLVRLLGFVLILIAVMEKNRKRIQMMATERAEDRSATWI